MSALSYFLSARVLLLLVGLVTVAVIVMMRARQKDTSWARSLLFGLAVMSLGGIVIATLLRDGFPDFQHWGNPFDWQSSGWGRVTADPMAREILLNVALFVPAGVLLSLWTRRPLLTWTGLVALSATIECLQAVVRAGVADPSDLLANSVGAGCGSVLAAACLIVAHLVRRRRPSWEVWATPLVAIMLGLLAAVGIQQGAAAALADVKQQVTEKSRVLDRAGYLRLERQDQVEDLWQLSDVRADGVARSDQLVTIRYPASYFFKRQCVLLELSDQGAQVRPATGGRCSSVNP